jgi:hypothetical protein
MAGLGGLPPGLVPTSDPASLRLILIGHIIPMPRSFAVFLFLTVFSIGRPAYGQAVQIPFVVNDGVDSVTLYAGLDPAATSGLDADLGETELPSFPPTGTFEARFIGTNVNAALGLGSHRDFRPGDIGHVGEIRHELKWQIGSGPQVTIAFDLPANVSAHLHDGLDGTTFDRVVRGSGTIEIENAGLTQIRLTLTYGVTNAPPRFLSSPVTEALVGSQFSYAVIVEDADGDPITLSMTSGPSWLALEDTEDGLAVLQGSAHAAGLYPVTLQASDGKTTVAQTFSVRATGQAMKQVGFTLSDARDSVRIIAGIDPAATNGIDAFLGEQELPPFPPSGSFDARFVGTDVPASIGEGSYRDYRAGSAAFEGDIEHRLRWQLGTGTELTIAYDLPSGVTARIRDVVTGMVVDESFSGAGEFTITNSNLTQARLTLSYTSNAAAVSARVMDGASPVAGVELRLTGPLTDRQAVTDASGRLTFAGVAMGEDYVVSIVGDAARYIPRSFTLNDLSGPVDVVFVRTQTEIASTVTLEQVLQVGSEGGNLTFGSGGGLNIPAGAVSGDQSIIVGRFDEAPPGAAPAGPLFYFGPPGTTFSTPATITVPYDPAMIPAGMAEEDLSLVRFDESTGAYVVVEPSTVDTNAKTISAQISSFSGYGAALSTSVSAETLPTVGFGIDALYPNPASSHIGLSYSLDVSSEVRLTIFDMLGREVVRVSHGEQSIGRYDLTLDTSGLPAGAYLVRFDTGRQNATRLITVMR